MAVKEYKLFATKAKLARENNLIEAKSHYYMGDDLFYDFDLFEKSDLPQEAKEIIQRELMEHHAVSWYEQPLPIFAELDMFTRFYGGIRTVPHRVYKSNGKRICVIIEVTGIKFEKYKRNSIYDRFYKETGEIYETVIGNFECDYEVA